MLNTPSIKLQPNIFLTLLSKAFCVITTARWYLYAGKELTDLAKGYFSLNSEESKTE